MGHLCGGRILRANLADQKFSTAPVAQYERFIGAKGVNLKLLFDGVDRETDPLGPENLLLFGAGPLVGTPFPAACRVDVMGKSPVTGHYGDSGMGGYFGPELKYAGYDNLIIEGRAEKPVYLAISDDRVEIRDASAVWGRDTYESPALIQQDLGDPRAQVICIGPAGENQAVYATIMSGTGNAAARTGLGAVMGSKNLKAIAVRGTGGITIARPAAFLDHCSSLYGSIREARSYDSLHTTGITHLHDDEMRHAYALLGTPWKGGEAIWEREFIEEHLDRRVGCFACPIACFDGYNIKGAGSGTAKCSPYGDLSWDVRNADLMVFWQAYSDCQRYGLDARSLSNALAWLMRLHEEGIITAADTDGIPMEWGSPGGILPMARKISLREGIGDLIAAGLPSAAEKIGRGSEDFLFMAKGSPSDLHVPSVKTTVLAAAVSPIGEDLQVQPFLGYASAGKYVRAADEASFIESIERYRDFTEDALGSREAADPRLTDGKAALVRRDEERADIIDMVGICAWVTSFFGMPVDTQAIAHAMTLGLGEAVDDQQLIEAALAMHHLERAFVGLCGQTREDDRLSKGYRNRINPGGRPLPELGFTDVELERMKDDYYRLMGWDLKTGLPNREILEKHAMADVADRLGL